MQQVNHVSLVLLSFLLCYSKTGICTVLYFRKLAELVKVAALVCTYVFKMIFTGLKWLKSDDPFFGC